MPVSQAKQDANRRNAAKSTGPKTAEGKERSRRNAIKHGLTGAGVVLPIEDQAEVDRRFAALGDELAPTSEMSVILVRRVATLSVRMERAVAQETTMLAEKVRRAAWDFDDRRLAEAEKLLDWIAAEPATNARRLGRTPEGVDRLIKAWLDLLEDLDAKDHRRWGYGQWQRIENLRGRRPEDFPTSRDGLLCKLLWEDASSAVVPDDLAGLGLDPAGHREWARGQIRERIAAEVARLQVARQAFDFESIALDRAEAASRATFDPSREATLARKYETAAERGMFRALNEFRQVEADLAEAEPEVEVEPEPESDDASPEEDGDSATVGSFGKTAVGVPYARRKRVRPAIQTSRTGVRRRRENVGCVKKGQVEALGRCVREESP